MVRCSLKGRASSSESLSTASRRLRAARQWARKAAMTGLAESCQPLRVEMVRRAFTAAPDLALSAPQTPLGAAARAHMGPRTRAHATARSPPRSASVPCRRACAARAGFANLQARLGWRRRRGQDDLREAALDRRVREALCRCALRGSGSREGRARAQAEPRRLARSPRPKCACAAARAVRAQRRWASRCTRSPSTQTVVRSSSTCGTRRARRSLAGCGTATSMRAAPASQPRLPACARARSLAAAQRRTSAPGSPCPSLR